MLASSIQFGWMLWLLACFQLVTCAAEDTCQHAAELPTEDSTHSYWHTNPSKILLGHRSTKDLPETADVVVIGSGIAGTFAARELVAGGKNVLMLEAREACWGATGRVRDPLVPPPPHTSYNPSHCQTTNAIC